MFCSLSIIRKFIITTVSIVTLFKLLLLYFNHVMPRGCFSVYLFFFISTLAELYSYIYLTLCYDLLWMLLYQGFSVVHMFCRMFLSLSPCLLQIIYYIKGQNPGNIMCCVLLKFGSASLFFFMLDSNAERLLAYSPWKIEGCKWEKI